MMHLQRNPTHVLLLLLALALAVAACKDRQNPKEYDRTALLANLADNVILPSYEASDAANGNLASAQAAFRAAPTAQGLDALQDAFAAAWLAWKPCSPLEFGPAASATLGSVVNTFPTDSSQIMANVSAGTWDLVLVSNLDARGFPAIDFLLHGLGSDDAAVLARYLDPADSASLQRYLGDLVADVKDQVGNVLSQWNGGYAADFKASTGTDVGSSTSLVVNELNRDLERIKHGSIGIPLGKQTFDQPLPEKAEGLYCGLSEELAMAQLQGIQALYQGKHENGADGYGLHDALAAVEVEYDGGPLEIAIMDQFATTRSKLEAMPSPLSEAVVNNRAPVEAAYTEVQKLVVLLKTDMTSALSILITYTDSDGD